jgi:uroporphyrinogen decarboxylase
MASELTSRERVDRAFRREPHDRIPRFEHFWTDTIRRWQGEGLDGDEEAVLRLLKADMRHLGNPWPEPAGRAARIIEETETTKVVMDAWGATHRDWKDRMGTPEHLGFACDSPEVWEQTFKPALKAATVPDDVAGVRARHAAAHKAGLWTNLTGMEGFEVQRRLIGDEEAMMAMVEEPEWIQDISRTYTDVTLAQFERYLEAGVEPDAIWLYGDMAYNHGTLCSPAMYRELIWPDHVRMVEWAHARGIRFIYHTDGDVNAVVPDYLDGQFDALQPLEAKAGMDTRQLIPAHGDQLLFFGNIDIRAMVDPDPAAIEAEIRDKFAVGKDARGYIYHSDHSVPPQVSWERYRYIIDLIDRYGSYD